MRRAGRGHHHMHFVERTNHFAQSVKMGKETVTRLFNQALGILRQISVEPCYLGYALSYGLYSIIVSEIYIEKVGEEDHKAVRKSFAMLS